MNKPFTWFIKITSAPIASGYFRKKVYYENDDKKLKKIKGAALIVSNHTSVYDYPLIMYTFFNRTIRTLIASTTYNMHPMLRKLLKRTGGIPVDRENFDFSFITEMSRHLKKGQLGLVFPESRLHTEKEDKNKLLEFKPSYVYLALINNVPIIPVYTNGIYGKLKKKYKDRARIIIGKPIYCSQLIDRAKSEKENIKYINDYVFNKVKNLKALLTNKVRKEVK